MNKFEFEDWKYDLFAFEIILIMLKNDILTGAWSE